MAGMRVNISANARPMRKGIADANRQIDGFAGRVSRIGRSMTLPMLAAAGGIAKIGFDLAQVSKEMDRTLTAATGATGRQLEQLKRASLDVGKVVPDNLTKVASVVGDISTRFGFTDDALRKTSKHFLDFAKITGHDTTHAVNTMSSAMTLFGEKGAKALEESLGDVLRIQQATGIEMAKFLTAMADYGAVWSSVGFTLEETAALFGELSRAGIEVSKVTPALKIFAKEMVSLGRDPRVALEQTVEDIKNATSDSAALNIAFERFGSEGGARFAEAILQGAFDLQQFGGHLADSTGLLAEQARAMYSVGDYFAIIGNQLRGIFIPIVDAVTRYLEDLLGVIIDSGWSAGLAKLREDAALLPAPFDDLAAAVFGAADAVAALISWGVELYKTFTDDGLFAAFDYVFTGGPRAPGSGGGPGGGGSGTPGSDPSGSTMSRYEGLHDAYRDLTEDTPGWVLAGAAVGAATYGRRSLRGSLQSIDRTRKALADANESRLAAVESEAKAVLDLEAMNAKILESTQQLESLHQFEDMFERADQEMITHDLPGSRPAWAGRTDLPIQNQWSAFLAEQRSRSRLSHMELIANTLTGALYGDVYEFDTDTVTRLLLDAGLKPGSESERAAHTIGEISDTEAHLGRLRAQREQIQAGEIADIGGGTAYIDDRIEETQRSLADLRRKLSGLEMGEWSLVDEQLDLLAAALRSDDKLLPGTTFGRILDQAAISEGPLGDAVDSLDAFRLDEILDVYDDYAAQYRDIFQELAEREADALAESMEFWSEDELREALSAYLDDDHLDRIDLSDVYGDEDATAALHRWIDEAIADGGDWTENVRSLAEEAVSDRGRNPFVAFHEQLEEFGEAIASVTGRHIELPDLEDIVPYDAEDVENIKRLLQTFFDTQASTVGPLGQLPQSLADLVDVSYSYMGLSDHIARLAGGVHQELETVMLELQAAVPSPIPDPFGQSADEIEAALEAIRKRQSQIRSDTSELRIRAAERGVGFKNVEAMFEPDAFRTDLRDSGLTEEDIRQWSRGAKEYRATRVDQIELESALRRATGEEYDIFRRLWKPDEVPERLQTSQLFDTVTRSRAEGVFEGLRLNRDKLRNVAWQRAIEKHGSLKWTSDGQALVGSESAMFGQFLQSGEFYPADFAPDEHASMSAERAEVLRAQGERLRVEAEAMLAEDETLQSAHAAAMAERAKRSEDAAKISKSIGRQELLLKLKRGLTGAGLTIGGSVLADLALGHYWEDWSPPQRIAADVLSSFAVGAAGGAVVGGPVGAAVGGLGLAAENAYVRSGLGDQLYDFFAHLDFLPGTDFLLRGLGIGQRRPEDSFFGSGSVLRNIGGFLTGDRKRWFSSAAEEMPAELVELAEDIEAEAKRLSAAQPPVQPRGRYSPASDVERLSQDDIWHLARARVVSGLQSRGLRGGALGYQSLLDSGYGDSMRAVMSSRAVLTGHYDQLDRPSSLPALRRGDPVLRNLETGALLYTEDLRRIRDETRPRAGSDGVRGVWSEDGNIMSWQFSLDAQQWVPVVIKKDETGRDLVPKQHGFNADGRWGFWDVTELTDVTGRPKYSQKEIDRLYSEQDESEAERIGGLIADQLEGVRGLYSGDYFNPGAPKGVTGAPDAPGLTMPDMSRAEIERLQRGLNLSGANLQVDGVFGPATEAALLQQQRQAAEMFTSTVQTSGIHVSPVVEIPPAETHQDTNIHFHGDIGVDMTYAEFLALLSQARRQGFTFNNRPVTLPGPSHITGGV